MFLFEVAAILMVITVSLLIHEMGHAVAWILQNKKARADIYMGSSSKENKLKLTIGRITFYLTISFSGFCSLSNPEELPPITNKQKIISAAGGPIASLFGFITLSFLSNLIPGMLSVLINRIAFISLIIFITSSLPYTYPSFLRHIGGFPTDGLRILNLLKENRKHQNVAS